MYARMLMGVKAKTPIIELGAKYLVEELPEWGNANERVNFYYWFFGTRALAMVGGDYWKAWQPVLRKVLVEKQRRDGDVAGTWDTVCHWSPRGGLVYMTALGALCLETAPPESPKAR
jgi:hypothetical protein